MDKTVVFREQHILQLIQPILTEEETNVKLKKRSLGRDSELNASMKQGQN